MKTKERLQTTLDRLPYGPEGMPEDQKVSKKLPEGVRSRELYEDIVRIAGPSFVELLLTQLTSMVDLMMVGSMGGTENLEMGTQALAAVGLTTQPKFLLMAAFVSMKQASRPWWPETEAGETRKRPTWWCARDFCSPSGQRCSCPSWASYLPGQW